MASLLKAVFLLAAAFAATFIVIKFAAGLTFDDVENWLRAAQNVSPVYLILLVIGLLLADLFVSVPTLTITMLAGYFLGQTTGSIAVLTGLYGAGLLGYVISRKIGDRLLRTLLKRPLQRDEATKAFQTHGFAMIMLARAMPILPEVTACMAGATGMPLARFLTAWSLNSVPYVLIATYAGSVSSLQDPMPAIYTAFGISGSLWLGWFLLRRRMKARATVGN